MHLYRALVAANLAKSKSEARTLIQSGAVSNNGTKVDSLEYGFTDPERLFGRFTVLRRDKKNYGLISWQ
ncbi:S4 domain-containing protein [Chitinimonas taiwanensis]|uniref:S4 domain-containing protein n=1 Tax=Chitinimonas taiwanensis DSM 18899 TaxID=1121279 RepID=A0A1K2HF28_9NEIS|nr:S4 domain-containing protein [Chitinimonas taiwanensis]SFZ75355.1 S4 domain-containing protein [Chitinimonas taiwanensis DSM 18899]